MVQLSIFEKNGTSAASAGSSNGCNAPLLSLPSIKTEIPIIKVRPHIQAISLYPIDDVGEIAPCEVIGDYIRLRKSTLKPKQATKKKGFRTTYKTLYEYHYTQDGSSKAYVYSNRKHPNKSVNPSFIISFEPAAGGFLKYKHVQPAEEALEELYDTFCIVKKIRLGIDFISPKDSGLFDLFNRSIVFGPKWSPGEINNQYYNAPKAGYIIEYSENLSDKKSQHMDVYRIIITLKPSKLHEYSVQSLYSAGSKDWSCLYGDCFRFHCLNEKSTQILEKIAKDERMFFAADIIRQNQITPDEFYREYGTEHPVLSFLVEEALKSYRWNPDER